MLHTDDIVNQENISPMTVPSTDNERLTIARYRITLMPEAPLRLPAYPGSMLRGSFGHGLRSVSCITRQRTCDGCPLIDQCHYPALFEPKPADDISGRFADVPAPYVIEVPLGTPDTLLPGQPFHFDMVLFGPAVAQLSTFILAWQRAAWHGLGKGRARAQLTDVAWESASGDWIPVYHAKQGAIIPHTPGIQLPTPVPCTPTTVTLTLETPTRLQHHGKLCSSHHLTARIVLQALQRKIGLYAHHYLDPVLSLPSLPNNVTCQVETQRYHWQRFSSRQQQKMALDGLIGDITLTGDLSAWYPWLWLGQYTHIGKNTSFGLGKYTLVLF